MTDWNWEPSVLVGLSILTGCYLYGIRQLRQEHRIRNVCSHPEGEGANSWQLASFMSGSLILLLALDSPLDNVGDHYLFSVHMIQHMLLALVVPLLWLVGLPPNLLDRLLEPLIIRSTMRAFVFPVAALLIFNLDIWLWHLPSLYDFALEHEQIHIVQHLSFMAAGVLNWWPVFSSSQTLPKISGPMRVIYLAVGGQMMSLLGILLVFANGPLYQSYVSAPRIFGIAPLADQQIGGLIMWIPGDLFYLVLISIVFLRWMEGKEDQTAQGERISAP